MWREMARIIHEVRPKFVFVENSPMLTSRGLGRVLGDLASMGFDAKWGVLGAADIGANHKRDRIWIVGKQDIDVADSNSFQRRRVERGRTSFNDRQKCGDLRGVLAFDSRNEQKEKGEILADSSIVRLQRSRQHEQSINSTESAKRKADDLIYGRSSEFWAIEPNVGRVVDGVANRVDRLKAIGNGQVPLCAATAWRLLSE
jgi:DNA (cytosine-5)-methyltransferase 1